MTQHGEGSFPYSKLVLLFAALIAAFAIGYAISHNQEPAQVETGLARTGGSDIIADLEKVANANSQNASAWQKLGLAYFGQSRFDDAAAAYAKATQIDAAQPALWSALGEARLMASEHDPMPGDAVTAFEKALSLDSADPRARYFLAVKRDLGGDHEGAVADWLALLEETPQDAPWRTDLVRTIEQVGKINKIDVAQKLAAAGETAPAPTPPPMAARAIPGPSAQDLSAASQMPPGEQREMAEGMVARLEKRLQGDPDNVDGWIMLMRSRMTLEQPEKAKQALTDALAANPGKADMLRQQGSVLGIR